MTLSDQNKEQKTKEQTTLNKNKQANSTNIATITNVARTTTTAASTNHHQKYETKAATIQDRITRHNNHWKKQRKRTNTRDTDTSNKKDTIK